MDGLSSHWFGMYKCGRLVGNQGVREDSSRETAEENSVGLKGEHASSEVWASNAKEEVRVEICISHETFLAQHIDQCVALLRASVTQWWYCQLWQLQ